MKIIFVVLTVAMIGLMAPNVFAENPITFHGIVDGYNHGVDVYINGHVNLKNNNWKLYILTTYLLMFF